MGSNNVHLLFDVLYATFDYTRDSAHSCPRVSITAHIRRLNISNSNGDVAEIHWTVKTTHEFEHSGMTPSLPEGGRAMLYHRPDRINNFADLGFTGFQGVSIYGTNAFSFPFRSPVSTSKYVLPTVHRLLMHT